MHVMQITTCNIILPSAKWLLMFQRLKLRQQKVTKMFVGIIKTQ